MPNIYLNAPCYTPTMLLSRDLCEIKPNLAQQFDSNNESHRLKITKMVMRLFDHWKLSTADQLELLGLSANSRRMLTQYRKGKAIPNNRDIMDRIGWLLLIHQDLKSLYPDNPGICYSWVSRANTFFRNFTPLAMMKRNGLLGIFEVAQLLEHLTQQ